MPIRSSGWAVTQNCANMNIETGWMKSEGGPLMIAGPCSAESEEQMIQVSKVLQEQGVDYVRAGIWKPRTRPNSFEGIGVPALKWLQTAKEETGAKYAIEVANPKHVEEALKADIDLLWIGARSTVNPFTVQEIAESLRGVDIPVLVKKPDQPRSCALDWSSGTLIKPERIEAGGHSPRLFFFRKEKNIVTNHFGRFLWN